jgi:hypothetical protein
MSCSTIAPVAEQENQQHTNRVFILKHIKERMFDSGATAINLALFCSKMQYYQRFTIAFR